MSYSYEVLRHFHLYNVHRVKVSDRQKHLCREHCFADFGLLPLLIWLHLSVYQCKGEYSMKLHKPNSWDFSFRARELEYVNLAHDQKVVGSKLSQIPHGNGVIGSVSKLIDFWLTKLPYIFDNGGLKPVSMNGSTKSMYFWLIDLRSFNLLNMLLNTLPRIML